MTADPARAEAGGMPERLHRFGIHVIPSDPRDRHDNPEVRPLVNGTDFIERDYGGAVCGDALSWLLPDGPFVVGQTPHQVEMAAWCGCACRTLDVTMRREGDTVVWHWDEPEADSPFSSEIRFDARQYDTEVERATKDRSWEWPSAAVARILGGILRSHTDWLDGWTCEVGEVWSPPGVLDEIRLSFRSYVPQPHGVWRSAGCFGTVRPVTDEDPTAQAERLAQEIMAGDPRQANGMRSDTPDAPLDDWLGTPRHFGPSSDKWHGTA
ncbi:hypothetical protein [Streptomyces triculaminicus]|uniref:hypothetical protein n=1 Tax=Streptomyces triculaminicus TaxID=2816232 RepID=UPI00379EB767